MIEIKDLRKTFETGFLGAVPGVGSFISGLQIKGIAQRVEAVRGLTLTVAAGEIYGFLGPNGAGKTTTLKMLMGLVRPTQGQGLVMGAPLGARQVRSRIGYLPEHPYFYEHLRPEEFLSFYGRLYGLSGPTLKRRAEELVDKVGLSHARERTLRKFSKGMVQRLGLAQALISDPDLVILDEPMSGLDPMGRKTVRDLIFELKDRGKTVFFSSHILQDVEMVCDRVGIMRKGQLVREGQLSELLAGQTQSVEFECGPLTTALTQLSARIGVEPRTQGSKVMIRFDEDGLVQEFLSACVREQVTIYRVSPIKRTLEELFVEQAHLGERS